MTVIHGQRFVVLIVSLKFVLVHATHHNLKTDTASLYEECGISSTAPSFRIVGGMESPLLAWPWMVAIVDTHGGNVVRGQDVFCDGHLITHTHVLTAAHCVYGHPIDHLALRLGEHDFLSDFEGAIPVDFRALSIAVHQKYNARSGDFDIAIIRMSGYVDFSDSIRPVCLPTRDMSTWTFEHMMTVVAGWGRMAYADKAPSHTLRHVKLEVIPNEVCEIALKGFKGFAGIHSYQLCTSSSGHHDACQGDSGGPLVIPINNRFFTIGIVSRGVSCGVYPRIFTRVTPFIGWIHYVINYI